MHSSPLPGTALASPILVLVRGPGIDGPTRLPLARRRTTVGSRGDTDITLVHSTVSRLHTEICCDDTRCRIRDAGSLTGTYLNRRPVDCADLVDGDEVGIGGYRMTYHSADSGDATTRPE